MQCVHNEFRVNTLTHRSDDRPQRFYLEIHIECTQCGMPFHFIGPKPGKVLSGDVLSRADAMITTMDGCELRVPIAMGPRQLQTRTLKAV